MLTSKGVKKKQANKRKINRQVSTQKRQRHRQTYIQRQRKKGK